MDLILMTSDKDGASMRWSGTRQLSRMPPLVKPKDIKIRGYNKTWFTLEGMLIRNTYDGFFQRR